MSNEFAPIYDFNDSRLEGIPKDFVGKSGVSINTARNYWAYEYLQDIFDSWQSQNNYSNMNEIIQPKKPKNVPQASNLPASQPATPSNPPPPASDIPITQKDDPDVKMKIELFEYKPVEKAPETKSEKKLRKRLEAKPLFDPEEHAMGMADLYPELTALRNDAIIRMHQLRQTLEGLSPKFRALTNTSNKIFASYIKDIHQHLQTIVLDHDLLKEEIKRAEIQFQDAILRREERIYDRKPDTSKGFFGRVLDTFSVMLEEVLNIENFKEIEVDDHEMKLRKTIQKTMTVKVREREEKAAKLIEELTETGVMDILNNISDNGKAYLMNVERYEVKRKNLYAQMIHHVFQTDRAKVEDLQEGILDFQEWVLEDLKDRSEQNNEYALFEDTLTSVLGFKKKPAGMSYSQWNAYLEQKKQEKAASRKEETTN